MANDLFISYYPAFKTPDNTAFTEALKNLGSWCLISTDLYYVRTNFDAKHVAAYLTNYANGQPLIVINASEFGHANLDPDMISLIQQFQAQQ